MNRLIKEPISHLFVIERNAPISKLPILKNLLDELHDEQIIYCQWKGHNHLDTTLMGDGDLDILLNEKQKENFELLSNRVGFKKFEAIKQNQYNKVEDYIGLDNSSGKVVHLHIYFRIRIGKNYLKAYHLGLEEEILSSRVFDNKFGIFCIDPVFELMLLYFDEALS